MKRAFAVTIVAGFVVCLLLLASTSQSRPRLTPNMHSGEGCSLQSVKGSYGFYRVGTTPNGPLGAVGVTTFDGHGGSTFAQTIRVNGVETEDLFTDGSVDASYSVDSNCTAQFLNPDGSAFGHAVVVAGGEEIYFISLSGQNTVTGVAKRMDPLFPR
jgi:hypothetical protein